MAERPITQIPIDQSYASTEGLYKQFLSDENKGLGRQRTVKQVFEDDFEGYGPGKLVISGRKDNVETMFYPDNPETRAYYKEESKKANLALGATNLPIILAPFLGIAGGAKTLAMRNPNVRSAVNVAQGKVQGIGKNISRSDFFQNLGKTDASQKQFTVQPIFNPTSKNGQLIESQIKAFLPKGSSLVKPRSDVGLESFAIKTQSIINKPKGGVGLSAFEILNQEGMVHNVFRDGTKSFENTKPPTFVLQEPSTTAYHNITNKQDKANILMPAITKWVKAHKKELYENPTDSRFRGNFGTIIYQGKKHTIGGVKQYFEKGKPLYLRPAERGDSRLEQSDFAQIDVAVKHLERMNEAFTSGLTKNGKRLGMNPNWLNPKIMRSGIAYGARKVREINKIIRKELGLDIQQEHPLGLASKGTEDPKGFFLGSGPQNLLLNTLEDTDAFSVGGAQELGISTKGNVKGAESITTEGPLAQQRKAEYEQEGWLQAISEYGIRAQEIKGDPFKAYNQILKERKEAIVRGEEIELRMPGSKVTMTDMLLIQQLGFTMDRTQAAQQIIAEREIIDRSIAAGVHETPKGLEILKKYIEHIDLKVEIQKARKAGKPFKEYKQESTPRRFYKKTKLPRAEAPSVNWKN